MYYKDHDIILALHDLNTTILSFLYSWPDLSLLNCYSEPRSSYGHNHDLPWSGTWDNNEIIIFKQMILQECKPNLQTELSLISCRRILTRPLCWYLLYKNSLPYLLSFSWLNSFVIGSNWSGFFRFLIDAFASIFGNCTNEPFVSVDGSY